MNKKKDIIKFSQFISENFNDTPETFVANALQKLKVKLDKIFEPTQEGNPNEIQKASDAIRKSNTGEKISLKDMGVTLEDSEISKYSKTSDALTLWFSDSEGTYRLYIMIKLEDAVPQDKEKDFSDKEIEKAFIRFKKYDAEDQYIGELTKTVKIKNIDEDFLVDLKIEIDKEYSGEDEEGLEFETE